MKADTFFAELEETYPANLAEEWDNPGLLAGRREKEISSVYLALDATDEVIEDAIKQGADLLLTHHPLLFRSIKQVNTDTLEGRRLVRLIQADILCYAMHTNYDLVTMAPLSSRMLGLTEEEVLEVTRTDPVTGCPEGFGRVGSLPEEMTLRECAEHVKETFGLDHVAVFGDPKTLVGRAAISPGSGKSMIEPALNAGAQVLITGDIGHHEGIDATARGLAVIDAGHYGLEHIFTGQMEAFIKEHCPELTVYREKIRNPIQIL